MASVILVNPRGPEEMTVSDVWSFTTLVYGQGWHPKTGTVDAAWQSLATATPPVAGETPLAGWSVEDLADAPQLRAAFDAWAADGGIGTVDLDGVVSLEELERATQLGTINATATRRLGPVNLDQRIGGLTLATSAAVAASDTNYWTISLQRLRAGQNPLTIATRTTKATAGEAFTADQGWNFDAMPWLETARYLRKGDVMALAFTKTGTPADLIDVTVAVRYEPSIRPVVRDTFSRVDSTSSLGVTDTGQAWTPLIGTWGITSSQGYAVATVGGGAYIAFDAARSDYTAAVRISTAGSFYGLLFRVVDGDNLWLLGNDALWKCVGGTFTSMGATTGWASGDVMSVACSGAAITAYRNGVQFASVTDPTFQTATKVGLFASSNLARLDDLELVA